MTRYVCPNGHQVADYEPVICEVCGAVVIYVPLADALTFIRDTRKLADFVRWLFKGVTPPEPIAELLDRYPSEG